MLKIVRKSESKWGASQPSQDLKQEPGQQAVYPEETLSRLHKLATHVRLMSGQASPSVMLLGLDKKSTVHLYRPFAELGWQVLPEEDINAGLAYLPKAEIDIIVFDLGQADLFSPLLIRKMRAAEPEGRRSKIVVLGQSIPPHLLDQLFEAGVDMVLPGSNRSL